MEAVEKAVLTSLQNTLSFAQYNKQKLVEMLMTDAEIATKKELSSKTKELAEAQNRVKTLDGIIQNLYEDKVCGSLTNDRFQKLTDTYDLEQKELLIKIQVLNEELSEQQDTQNNIQEFIKQVDKYCKTTELTPEIVNAFIDKVLIYEKEKIDGLYTQQIEIVYNFVGAINIEQ